MPGLCAISQPGLLFPVMIQIIWNKIEEIIVVLGNFRPYSSCFRSYNGELRTDIEGFLDVFRGFRGEIGKNMENWGNFRSYYRDLRHLIPVISGAFRDFLYKTGENVVLGKFLVLFRVYSQQYTRNKI